MGSSGSAGAIYQVFLSFRGPDTRLGITNVLYHALRDAGIRVFLDDEEIRKGEKIGEELLRALDESRIFMPIFSRGYASSKWCLIEFTKMVKLEEGSRHKKIIPIFYDVTVDDVKLRTELYSKALEEHAENYDTDTVQQWENALRQTGKFKGWEVKKTGHADFAKEVVRDVSIKLKVKNRLVTEYFVQSDDQVNTLIWMLRTESPYVQFVGIYGMGGIGKTTLAKVVFNEICDRFDCCSFLADVREESRQHKGIEQLQKQLLGDLGLGSWEIRDLDEGIKRMSEMLVHKKVLIVLDDVDHVKQISNLAKNASWFGSGSRIIITTQDQRVLETGEQKIHTMQVKEMKPEEAARLFSMHAFKKDSPPGDYLSLSEDVVTSTGGLPLALEVIGSQLRDKPFKEWVDTAERLKKMPHRDVEERLMISYKALTPEAKQIFLDIACFFVDHEKTYPMYMWQAYLNDAKRGLKELIYMSLIKTIARPYADQNGITEKSFWMHDQLRYLGRKIVYDDILMDVYHSRLWIHQDALEILRDGEGKEKVEMLLLRLDDLEEVYDTLTQRELSSLRKLRYLECSGGIFSGELECVLPKLRWLSCHESPPEFTGTGLCLKNLVTLDLSRSCVSEKWSGWKKIGVGSKLKVLDLTGCKCLRKTPDLSSYSSLERLILRDCTNLVEIDPSIARLVKLDLLCLEGCRELETLPICVGNLKSLVVLNLSLSGITRLPYSVGNLKKLRAIKMFGCRIRELPSSIGMLKRLEELEASFTPLEEIPSTIEGLTSLRILNLDWVRVHEIPPKLPPGLVEVCITSPALLQKDVDNSHT